MTEFGIPFDMPQNPDNPDDYLFSAAEERMRIGAQMTDGVFPEIRLITTDATAPEQVIGNSLVVTAGEGMNVILGKGIALCGSTFYFNTAEKIIPVSEGINDIVIELNLADDKISAINQTRADGNIEDSLVRTVSRWQIALATVTVPEGTETIDFSMITDHRLNTTPCSSPDGRPVCGLVGSALQLSSDMILDEWKSIKNKLSSEWEYIKNKLDEDAAVHILNLIGNLSNLSTSTKENLVAAINEVVSTLEDHQLHLEEHDLQIDSLIAGVRVPRPALKKDTFSSEGTFTWTCPEDVHKVSAYILGGSQGGYSAYLSGKWDTTVYATMGEGTSGNAFLKEDIPVIPGQSYEIVVGAGGIASAVTDAQKETITQGSGKVVFSSGLGTAGSPSTAFGYSSENTPRLHYYKRAQNTSSSATKFTPATLSGSEVNIFEEGGTINGSNGAPGKNYSTYDNTYFHSEKQDGKSGKVVIYYY